MINYDERIETGALQVDNDWTGLFISEDDTLVLLDVLRPGILTVHGKVLSEQLIKAIYNDVPHSAPNRKVQRIKTK